MKSFLQKYGLWVAVVALLLVKGETLFNLVMPTPSFAVASNTNVIMYSTSWCGYCKKMRQFLQANDVPFVERDIEASEENRALYDKLGVSGIPVVIVNGEVVKGYNPRKVASLASEAG